MARLILCLFFVLVKLQDALSSKEGEHYRAFTATLEISWNDKISDAYLLKIRNGVSKMQCLVGCGNMKDCYSFFYTKLNTECQMHRQLLMNSSQQSEHRSGSRYYNLQKQEGNRGAGKLVGENCTETEECSVPHSECRTGGTCTCVAGYSYRASSLSCEIECTPYGNTFQVFEDYVLLLYDKSTLPFIDDANTCAEFCLRATFICKSFDYDSTSKICYLQDVDASDVAVGTYVYSPLYKYYQRNCA